jgi:hypothetical protein
MVITKLSKRTPGTTLKFPIDVANVSIKSRKPIYVEQKIGGQVCQIQWLFVDEVGNGR